MFRNRRRPRPSPATWFKADTRVTADVPAPGDFRAVCRSWHLAGTEGGGDDTVGTLMALD